MNMHSICFGMFEDVKLQDLHFTTCWDQMYLRIVVPYFNAQHDARYELEYNDNFYIKDKRSFRATGDVTVSVCGSAHDRGNNATVYGRRIR